MKYWFVNRYPYFMVCYNPNIKLCRCHPTTIYTAIHQTRVFFVIAHDCWRKNIPETKIAHPKGHSTCRSMLRPKQRVAWILQFHGKSNRSFPQTPMPRKSPPKNKAFLFRDYEAHQFPLIRPALFLE